ncbi:MAG: TIM barrel protein [Clostridiales bacterium]|nr:TIM barrel protein [Clostridiales bacterium]
MSERALFGVAGNSDTFTKTVSKSSTDAPAWLKSVGLDAYEYQCGKGVHVGKETAEKIGRNAAQAGIQISLHAPYFINLANPDPEMLQKTVGYVTASCQVAQFLGAERIVIHSGALMKRSRREALDIAKGSLREILRVCDDLGCGGLTLCPETMGKINQLGDLDEVLELCTLDERLLPCVDFGHLYARSLGALEGEEACEQMLSRMAAVLGEDRASRFHSHFSHIEYTLKGGEKRHLRFSDGQYGPDFAPLARAIARRGWHPTIICESAGSQSEDALEMKACYLAACRETAASRESGDTIE